ncbi:MAG: hypothetical protein HC830_14115, partial [Bacteroidetes bacterium]|nr:hypothetical protein [Bacteroidota bacterium]
VLIVGESFSQYSPNTINYQAVVRDKKGDEIINKSITVYISILSNSVNGTLQWKEKHTVTTNSFGLFTLGIGSGEKLGGVAENLQTIEWGKYSHFLQVETDFGSGPELSGSTQLFAVPYALYAETSGNSEVDFSKVSFDANTSTLKNDGNTIADLTSLRQSLYYDPATSHLTISGMPGVIDLAELKHSPQDLRIQEDKVWLTGNKDSTIIDLKPYKQTLRLTAASKLEISGVPSDKSVSIDTSSVNEIQTLIKTGNKITLSKNGGEVTVDDADADAGNELILDLDYEQATQKLTIKEGLNTKSVPIIRKKIAFRALKTNSLPLTPGQSATVLFADEKFDSELCFNALTGVFKVPQYGSGIYCFFFNLNWNGSDIEYLKFDY